jgi:tRNA pseudouridine32 synthase / 23S rRNA pseudouridine746 synthase
VRPGYTDLPITVRYADAALLVLEKPAGLLSVPGRGPDKQDCLSARVQRQYPDARVVHRLDMATSGLMLMARGAQALTVLNHAFANREVHKRYQALVHGSMASAPGDWQTIDLPIAVDWPNRPLRIIDAGGKASLTRWRRFDDDAQSPTQQPLSRSGLPVCRLELEPVTGRSHQLRVHLRAIGHPIVGDALYGNAMDDARLAAARLMLHASSIALRHPVSGEPMAFTSAPDF